MKRYIQNSIRLTARPILENPLWAFFTYTVLAACNLMIAYGGSRILGLLQLFLELYIASAILMLIPQKGRAIAKHTISLIIYAVCAVDLYCWNRLGSPITPTLLNTFLLTDSSEATEALSSYLDIRSILPALIPVTLGATHTVLASCKKCRSMIKDIAQKFCMHMGIATTALFVVSTTTCLKNEIYLFHRLILGHDEKETYMATGTEPTLRFYTPLHRLANAIVEIIREKDAIIHLQENIDNSHIDSCSFTSPEIVLIIGESYNRHHSQLYGYDKETTPKQLLHMNEGRLIPFSNAIAQWNLTSDAFRTLLSTDVATDENKWYDYPLFTVLFRKAGYDVTFISNQYVRDEADTYSDFNENILVNDKVMSDAQFNRRNTRRYTFDKGVIDEFEAMERDTVHNGRLTIFHLMGQHIEFESRYPAAWARFDASMYDKTNINDSKTTAHYDNATLYNDHVLDRIISLFKEEDAIILFLADHGERTCDDGTGFGRSFSFNEGDVRQQYEIPMWAFITDKYRKLHPLMAQKIMDASDKPVCTDNIAHMLLHLGGIHTPHYNRAFDPLSTEFDPTTKRTINGEHDYDSLSATWK